MGLRELKETAHQQFVRGKFAQCAQTYQQILRLAPEDPNMHVRHAEACRRAGDRQQAIASYRAAANLLLELGCESRARGALKAALELDPKDPFLQADIARLETFREGPPPASLSTAGDELPLLPPLESGLDPVPPPPPTPRLTRAPRAKDLLRTPALPPIHRALPSAPSVPPAVPPVLLPAPVVRTAASGTPAPASTSRTEGVGRDMSSSGHQPPMLRPAAALPPRSTTMGSSAQAARPAMSPILTPRPESNGIQPAASAAAASNLRAASSPPRGTLMPPPPPAEALVEAARDLPPAQAAPVPATPEPSRDSGHRLEVRRLSPGTLAFRCSPNDHWAVIRSHTPLEMHVVEDLEKLPPMMRDLPADMTVAEAASNMVH